MTAFLPTLKQLQYLTALHIHGHFGRADLQLPWEDVTLVAANLRQATASRIGSPA